MMLKPSSSSKSAKFSKKALRKKLLKIRKAWNAEASNTILLSKLMIALEEIEHIGLYISIHNEAVVTTLIKSLPDRKFYLPRVNGKALEYVRYNGDPTRLQTSEFGVPEPTGPVINIQELEVLLIPGIAYTHDGYRLGYGGGFYDRFFSRKDTQGIHSIGICFDFALLDTLPVEAHDQKMKQVITD